LIGPALPIVVRVFAVVATTAAAIAATRVTASSPVVRFAIEPSFVRQAD